VHNLSVTDKWKKNHGNAAIRYEPAAVQMPAKAACISQHNFTTGHADERRADCSLQAAETLHPGTVRRRSASFCSSQRNAHIRRQ